jgi:ABC-type lipoprotein release transport system permease subunit
MLLKIAWRNVWRSRGRSFVVMGAMVVGIWALIMGTGFMNGFMVGYMANIINHDVSNIQVHNPEFKKDFEVNYFIPNGRAKAEELSRLPGVRGATTRMIVYGMIASPKKAAGVQIRGIDIAKEARVTNLDSIISSGTYFEGVKRNPIVIGSKLAETLQVKVRSKVVLTFNNAEGDITAAAFRIAGIVTSSSLNISQGYAFVRQADLDKILGMNGEIHEIAVITDPQVEESRIIEIYQKNYPQDLAESWREIAPELAFMQEMYGSMLYVLMGIIMTALIFGIVNTMLMAVLERFKELGMLMAIGMTKMRVFIMVLLETLYLGVVGAPIGLLAGWTTILYYKGVGVDLTEYSEGLAAFGYSAILYPYVHSEAYYQIAVAVLVTALVGAIYPAWKAIKLKPVEALHSI